MRIESKASRVVGPAAGQMPTAKFDLRYFGPRNWDVLGHFALEIGDTHWRSTEKSATFVGCVIDVRTLGR